jgi:hypothetical protein
MRIGELKRTNANGWTSPTSGGHWFELSTAAERPPRSAIRSQEQSFESAKKEPDLQAFCDGASQIRTGEISQNTGEGRG